MADFLKIADIIGDLKKGIPALVPVSKASWDRGVAQGYFPQPVRFGHVAAWRREDIEHLLKHGTHVQRKNAKPATPPPQTCPARPLEAPTIDFCGEGTPTPTPVPENALSAS